MVLNPEIQFDLPLDKEGEGNPEDEQTTSSGKETNENKGNVIRLPKHDDGLDDKPEPAEGMWYH
ncbi:hypothetical protein C0581_00255 [Candidatus Parcubacteria bacterium]|nr:MAG: hypothetical protein C0581_00255 [Candidatus Parcubacteria bacterium]